MEPLTTSVAVVLGRYAVDKGIELGKELGPKALDAAKDMFTAVLNRLRRKPKGEVVADGFEENVEVYRKPLEHELDKEITADPVFTEELKALMAQFDTAAKQHSPDYKALLTGSGAIAQGPGAVAAGAGGIAIGGSVQGGVMATSKGLRGEEENQ
jgi:hypothetical protein